LRRLAAALLLVAACGAPPPPPAAPGPPPFDAAAAEKEAARELDDFHDAAAHADEARYFDHFADGGVFLGTDAEERWDVPAFRAYAHARFAEGKGWVYHVEARHLTFAPGGAYAWFDERLTGEKAGPTRGSGVLVRERGRWRIAQYNLTFTVPNDRFAEFRAVLAQPASVPLRVRRKTAYEAAVAAASRGDDAAAVREIAALVPEAKTMPGDDLEFWLHNDLTWLKWSQGDGDGALAEVEAARATLDHGTLPDGDRRSLRLHERWDRSYLLAEKARARKGAMADADAARQDYEAIAVPAGDHDGLAVLEAFFALEKGDARSAARAAGRVDAEKDEDVQDLYVIALALDASGKKDDAARIRARICATKTYLMKPLIVRRLAQEGHACASPAP
jgi:SnoaL-like protein